MKRSVSVQLTFEERRRLTRAGNVTMRAVRGLPSFRTQTLFAAFDRAVRMTRRDDFRVVEFSVQEDHVHLIIEADDNGALARGMKSFSVRANRLFNAAVGRGRGRLWADRHERRELTSPRQVRDALVYCFAIRQHDDGPCPTEEARTVLLHNT